MSKFTKFTITALFVFAFDFYSQPISTLNQVMTSNPLISRPVEFRSMQLDVYSQLQSTEPGLKANYIYKQMAEGRKYVLKYLEIPKLEHHDNSIIIKLPVVSESLVIPDAKANSPDSLIKKLKLKMREGLIAVMERENFFSSKIGISLLSHLNKYIESSDLAVNTRENFRDGSNIDKFSSLLSEILFNSALKWLQLQDPIAFAIAKIDDPDKLVAKLNDAITEINWEIQDRMNEILDKVEDEISRAINSFSSTLVSGNMGLAVTEGDGALNGGVLLSFICGESLQIGLYVNGQLNNDSTSVDSTMVNYNMKPNQSMFGGQLRYAWDKVQLDLLFSVLFKDKDFEFAEVFEGGLGISYAPGADIIVGLAYYTMINTKEGFENIHLVGLNVMAKNRSVPSFLLGAQFTNGKTTPVFQISQPINF